MCVCVFGYMYGCPVADMIAPSSKGPAYVCVCVFMCDFPMCACMYGCPVANMITTPSKGPACVCVYIYACMVALSVI